MNDKRWKTWIVAAVTVFVFGCALTQIAAACPNCKNGLMEGDEASQRLIQGYFWSIIFMMSMPFAILIGVGGYMYREVKRAQRAQPPFDPTTPTATPTGQPNPPSPLD